MTNRLIQIATLMLAVLLIASCKKNTKSFLQGSWHAIELAEPDEERTSPLEDAEGSELIAFVDGDNFVTASKMSGGLFPADFWLLTGGCEFGTDTVTLHSIMDADGTTDVASELRPRFRVDRIAADTMDIIFTQDFILWGEGTRMRFVRVKETVAAKQLLGSWQPDAVRNTEAEQWVEFANAAPHDPAPDSYTFAEGGKVTVNGNKETIYALNGNELLLHRRNEQKEPLWLSIEELKGNELTLKETNKESGEIYYIRYKKSH